MLVPKLRFKEFTDEWKKLNLEKNFIYFPTNSFSRSELTTTGSIKNVHYGDIHKKYKSIVSCSNHINSFVKENIITKGTQIAENDLIFADASEDYDGIGKAIEIININNEIVYSGLHTIHARDINKNFSPSFQGYYFNTKLIQHQFRVMANGFKVFGISKKNINSLNVNIPSLKEQKKIAKLFTLLDKLIELQQRKIEALKLYNKGIKKKLLNYEIIDELPLFELSTFTNGKGHESTISNDGKFIVVNSKFISSDGVVIKRSNSQLLPLYKNDIVMVMSDVPNGKAIAKCYFVNDDNIYTLNQRICKIKAKQEIIDSKYLYYKLNRNNYFLRFDDGVKQTNLRKDDVMNITIAFPLILTQKKISSVLTNIDKLVFTLELKNKHSIELKKGLLQQMFV